MKEDDKMMSSNEPETETEPLSQNYNVFEEKKDVKTSKKSQILACTAVQLTQMLVGLAMAHTSTLIPQLEAPGSSFQLTRTQSAWTASVMTIALPVGSLLGGWVMNTAGRLNAVKLTTIPFAASWVVVALAQSFEQLLVSRILMGASLGLGVNAAFLYTAEVAEKDIRGGLSCMGTALVSVGILFGFVAGAYLDWRTAAWSYLSAPILLLVLVTWLAVESPVWLRDRGRLEAARTSSFYFYRDPEMVLSVPRNPRKAEETLSMMFRRPAVLKPVILVNAMFFLQQVMGVSITIFFAVTFFQESGSDVDPYLSAIVFGVIRLVLCSATSLSAGRVGRRALLVMSSLGMGTCMLTSALATRRILAVRAGGELAPSWMSWIVVGCILLFVAFGSTGIQTLPWGMMAELVPHEVRGLAQTINMATAHVYIFAGLQLYPTLSHWLGGSAGMQLFFCGSSYFAAVYFWLCLPETRGRSLQEIEDFFQHHTIYPGHKKRKLINLAV